MRQVCTSNPKGVNNHMDLRIVTHLADSFGQLEIRHRLHAGPIHVPDIRLHITMHRRKNSNQSLSQDWSLTRQMPAKLSCYSDIHDGCDEFGQR